MVPFLQSRRGRCEATLLIMMTGSSQTAVRAQVCPFCGVATVVGHETQAGCIEALQVEIARMRGILDHVRPLGALTSTHDRPEDTGA